MAYIEPEKIRRMFDYLRLETSPLTEANGAFVFGRASPLVANRAVALIHDRLVDYALIVGGIGKDSGALRDLECPEAVYIGGLMRWKHGVPDGQIWIEPRPRNGGECCEMGIEFIVNNDLRHEDMTVVIHPTSLRRIRTMLDLHSRKKSFKARWQSTGTAYEFDPQNPADQKEAVAELLRLADWPYHTDGTGRPDPWCAPSSDLPLELVQVARDYDAAWKA